MRKKAKILCMAGIISLSVFAAYWVYSGYRNAQGIILDTLDGVPVYNNGFFFTRSYGRHYAADGYYYGKKWQCVEFIKRYLYDARGHQMPDVWGHAINFFDPALPDGDINLKRNMWQFRQGGSEKPLKGDLLVFSGISRYGHVAIIADVHDTDIEIVQQNLSPPRERIPLSIDKGFYYIEGKGALGWLRVRD